MIKLLKKDINNGVDNGEGASCSECNWYEEAVDMRGCGHPILYDDNGDIIEEVNDAIIECMYEPRYCCLMERSKHMTKLSLNSVIMKLRNFGFEPTYHNDGWNEKIVIDNLGEEATQSAKNFIGRHYPEIKIVTR